MDAPLGIRFLMGEDDMREKKPKLTGSASIIRRDRSAEQNWNDSARVNTSRSVPTSAAVRTSIAPTKASWSPARG